MKKEADVIYSGVIEGGFRCVNTIMTPSTPIEYIRKDALLEWAKDEMKKFQRIPYANGEMRMLNALIDKINEL